MDNKAVIYARVSSTGERQSTARQVADLKRYAAASGMGESLRGVELYSHRQIRDSQRLE